VPLCKSATRMEGTEAPSEQDARPSWSVQHTNPYPAQMDTGSSDKVTVKDVLSTVSKHWMPEVVTRAVAAHTLRFVA
jgi:hypothetical protein